MAEGDHFVRTPWGFLGVRLPEEDEEWMGYRATILMGLGVLDAEGQPTPMLDVVVAGDMARLDAETFNAERKRITDVCVKCHSPSYVDDNMANADKMLKEADKLFAEAINIIKDLRKDGVITVKEGDGVYPQLLSFYEVDTKVEQILYEMFMDHRMKTFQGAFHLNPDYTTWYGYAKMKKDLVEIKEMDRYMRKAFEAEKAS
jgi:hypothetical protein